MGSNVRNRVGDAKRMVWSGGDVQFLDNPGPVLKSGSRSAKAYSSYAELIALYEDSLRSPLAEFELSLLPLTEQRLAKSAYEAFRKDPDPEPELLCKGQGTQFPRESAVKAFKVRAAIELDKESDDSRIRATARKALGE